MTPSNCSFTQSSIREIIVSALRSLYENDAELIYNRANERAITHRLACYIENMLRGEGFHVDCEYNRDMRDVKRIGNRSVFPDIIVHKRMSRDANLLVMEVKCDWNLDESGRQTDAEKLRGFKNPPYSYAHAAFLDIHDAVNDSVESIEFY